MRGPAADRLEVRGEVGENGVSSAAYVRGKPLTPPSQPFKKARNSAAFEKKRNKIAKRR